jgi:hypothetical protein
MTGRINLRKLLLGGLIAGTVISVGDVVLFGSIVKAPMAVAMQRLPPMTSAWRAAEVPWFILLDVVAGIFLIWLYAAIRPRFGAGVRTAVIAGLAGWFSAGLLCNLIQLPNGIMPLGLTIIIIAFVLIEYVLAAVIGAKIYTEDSSTLPQTSHERRPPR